jgi:hypothetical protein
MNITTANLVRWSGLAAMGAGILFIAIQPVHPPDVLESVTTTRWLAVHIVAVLMSLFGMLGVTGLYARQANKAGWLGLVGYLLFALFWAITLIFQFNEAFLIPAIASVSAPFVEGHLGIVTSTPSAVDLGAIPVIYMVNGLLYALGGLLFGIATFRAGVLPRWGGALLAAGAVAPFVLAMLPHPLDRSFAVPMGLALAWLGYALVTERMGMAASNASVIKTAQLNPSAAK